MPEPGFTSLIDLVSERLGGTVLEASDDFFAPKENLVKQDAAVFKPGLYTDEGKWMDGWESRRKRDAGHDWAILKMGLRGVIKGLDVDTSHFKGNHPPEFSIDAIDGNPESESWIQVVPPTAILEDSHNFVAVNDSGPWTHLRLNIFPDGGVARLRVFGQVQAILPTDGREIELSAIANGGLTVACSNEHFGRMGNLLLPDVPRNMGDGWETRRRRGPGHDWVVVRLGTAGQISRVEVETTFYKGNYPDRCSLEGSLAPGEPDARDWTPILAETRMQPDTKHVFSELMSSGPFLYVRLGSYPDGGVARLRVFGTRSEATTSE
ncbi:MAG: allantoicase [Rhodothermales bacterium]|jgi:allantoicase